MCERGVPGRALNPSSTSSPEHGRSGDLPLHGKILTAESRIEPGTSLSVVRRSDHQATRLAAVDTNIVLRQIEYMYKRM
jgi:hypothetical protein